MLRLYQVDQPFTWERDHITGEYITYGQFYYKDDTDGLVISRKTYKEAKEAKRRAEWDYSRLERAESQREYEQAMRDATRAFKAETLLDREIEEAF